MTDIEKMIENIDYVELHKLQTLTEGYNQPIFIYEDGSMDLLSQGSRPDTDEYYVSLTTSGRGNVEIDSFSEGWTTEKLDEYDNPTGNFVTDDGRIITEEEMIIECIECGEWQEVYEFWKEDFRRQYQDDVLNGHVDDI